MTIGDSYIQGNDILGYNSKIRGISISDNSYNVKRSGREITINGEAPKNSLVEVYQNGKIADYQNIDVKDYEFILDMRTQNDEFKIKIYDRNGVLIEERNLNIMGGSGFLTKGDWDDLKYGISHGFTNNLTYSLDYYDTKDEEKLYRYLKHRTGYRFSNLPIPLVTNISYYDSLEDKSDGYIAEVKTEILSHKLYYTYEHYTDTLATDEGKDYYHEAEISGDYKRSDYFFRFSNKTYMKSVVEKYDIGLSYDITKNLRVNMDLRKTIKKDDKRRTNYTRNIGLDYGRNGFTYSLDTRYDKGRDPNWKYTGSIRKRLGKDRKYSYNMDVKYDENDSFTFGFGFEYKFNDFFKMDYDYSKIMIDPTLRTDDFHEIQIIPASGRNVEVGLLPLSMIMGSIYLPDIENKKINKFLAM